MERKIAIRFLLVGLLLLMITPKVVLTGNAVNFFQGNLGGFSIFQLIGLAFIFTSILIFIFLDLEKRDKKLNNVSV